MDNRSLPRRRFVFGSLTAGVGALFLGCGQSSPLAPGEVAAKPVIGGLRRRLQVKQAIHILSPRPLTPLQALQMSGAPYATVDMPGGKFVSGVNNAEDLWIFLVDGAMPDLSGGSMVTRLGKRAVNSPQDIRQFRAGTIGLSMSTGTDSAVRPPTAEIEFAPAPGQGQVLISWLQVGLLQPDAA